MTEAQTRQYFRLWGRVRKALVEFGDFSKEDADAERHLIHEAALGKPKSSKDFNKTTDVDKVFQAFDEYLVLFDGPKNGNRAKDQPRLRLIYAIEQLGLPEPYIARIASDQFGTDAWRDLTERKLTWLRFTCTARSRSKSSACTAPANPSQDPAPADVDPF
jgi:hypothetical protein